MGLVASYGCHFTLKTCNSVSFMTVVVKIKEQQLGKVWDFLENLQTNQQQALGMN